MFTSSHIYLQRRWWQPLLVVIILKLSPPTELFLFVSYNCVGETWKDSDCLQPEVERSDFPPHCWFHNRAPVTVVLMFFFFIITGWKTKLGTWFKSNNCYIPNIKYQMKFARKFTHISFLSNITRSNLKCSSKVLRKETLAFGLVFPI